LCKIKWAIRNLKRRNFHSTSTEDGLVGNDLISNKDLLKE